MDQPKKRPLNSLSPQEQKKMRLPREFVLTREHFQCNLLDYHIEIDANQVPTDTEKIWTFEEKYRQQLNKMPLRRSLDDNNVMMHHRLDAMSDVTWVL